MQLINCNTNKNSEISPHPTIVNDIPLYSHNFYRLLYEIVVSDVFFKFIYYSNPGVHFLDALLRPALKLWLDTKIYTVERLIQTCDAVYITWVSILS